MRASISYSSTCKFIILRVLEREVGITCFSQFLLVAHSQKPSKPHFHDQSDGEEAKKAEETCEDFSIFYLPSQNATRTKAAGTFQNLFEGIVSPLNSETLPCWKK